MRSFQPFFTHGGGAIKPRGSKGPDNPDNVDASCKEGAAVDDVEGTVAVVADGAVADSAVAEGVVAGGVVAG